MLDDERPRLVIEILQAFDEPVTLADLAEEVAIRERQVPITAVSGETVAGIYHSLYHTHVPELADAGIIEYDQDNDMVHVAAGTDLDRLTGAGQDPD